MMRKRHSYDAWHKTNNLFYLISGNINVYRYIRKTKAHSLIIRRVVAPLPRVCTLVLGKRITYTRKSYENVNLKAHNQLLVITSHTLLKMDN